MKYIDFFTSRREKNLSLICVIAEWSVISVLTEKIIKVKNRKNIIFFPVFLR